MFNTITMNELEAELTNACRVWEVVDFSVYWAFNHKLVATTPYIDMNVQLRWIGTVNYPRWNTELYQITDATLFTKSIDVGHNYDAFIEYATKMQDVLNNFFYPKKKNLLVIKEVEKEAKQ